MRRPLIIAVLVVLAGCSGVIEDPTDRDPYGVDDVVEPDGTADASVPPGLEDDGLEDDRALLESHDDELADESYSVHAAVTVTDIEGDELFTEDHWTFRETTERWHTVERQAGEPVTTVTRTTLPGTGERRLDHWEADDERFQRLESDGGVDRRAGVHWETYPAGERLEAGLAAIDESTVHTRTFEGEIYYEIDGETPTADSPYLEEGFDATVYVRADGLIEYYELEGTIIEDGREVVVTEELTVYDVGETDLEEPTWVEETR